jgi:hypothetical protein
MPSFSHIAWKDAVIKAPAPILDGKRTGNMQVFAFVKILPLMPASSDIINRVALNTPTKLLVTYFETTDEVALREGSILTVDNMDYPVKMLSPWQYGGRDSTVLTYELVVEDLKTR